MNTLIVGKEDLASEKLFITRLNEILTADSVKQAGRTVVMFPSDYSYEYLELNFDAEGFPVTSRGFWWGLKHNFKTSGQGHWFCGSKGRYRQGFKTWNGAVKTLAKHLSWSMDYYTKIR